MSSLHPFIDELARDLKPVKRVAPVWLRTLVWAPSALFAGFLTTRLLHREPTDWLAQHALLSGLNAALSIVLGIVALGGALSVSIAGHRMIGKGWFAGGIALWLFVALMSTSLSARPYGAVPGEGLYCYTFVVIAGLPMIALVIAALRRTRSLTPGRSLLLASTGIAFLSFGLLAFCHSADMSLVDMGMHILGALTLGGITLLMGYRAIGA